jgi:hypothetical protein
MNEDTGYDFYRSFFAVLAGVLSAIAVGFLIKAGFEKFINFDPLNELYGSERNFPIQLAAAGWLFISSFVGGFVCSRIAGKNDMSHIIIGSLVVLALYFLIGGTAIFNEKSIASWAILLAIPIGYSIGEWIGGMRKSKET